MIEKQDLKLPTPAGGAELQQSLSRALGGPVTDQTHYGWARAYHLHFAVAAPVRRKWKVILRVRINPAGPYATQVFVQEYRQHRWWAGPVRTDRNGFYNEDAKVLTKLRNWYQQNGIQELGGPALAEEVEPGLTRFKQLFGSEAPKTKLS